MARKAKDEKNPVLNHSSPTNGGEGALEPKATQKDVLKSIVKYLRSSGHASASQKLIRNLVQQSGFDNADFEDKSLSNTPELANLFAEWESTRPSKRTKVEHNANRSHIKRRARDTSPAPSSGSDDTSDSDFDSDASSGVNSETNSSFEDSGSGERTGAKRMSSEISSDSPNTLSTTSDEDSASDKGSERDVSTSTKNKITAKAVSPAVPANKKKSKKADAPAESSSESSSGDSSDSESEDSSDDSDDDDDDKKVARSIENRKQRTTADDSNEVNPQKHASETAIITSSSDELASGSDSSSEDSDSASDSDSVSSTLESTKKKFQKDEASLSNRSSSKTISPSKNVEASPPVNAIATSIPNGHTNKRKHESDSHSPPAADVPDAKRAKGVNQRFQRISKDTVVDPRFSSNAYQSYDYADRAYRDLVITKGKGFTKEKNKKKRGSYRGGMIDTTAKSIRFED